MGAGLLIAALVYLYSAFQAAALVNTNPEKGNQMAYLQYGYRLWESGYTFKRDRNRMPALPMILAVTYQKGWHLEEDFFPRTKTLCVLLVSCVKHAPRLASGTRMLPRSSTWVGRALLLALFRKGKSFQIKPDVRFGMPL